METKKPIMLFCDHCGEENPKKQMCNFEAIPFEVASANIGESASICLPCFIKLEKEFHQKEKEMIPKPYVYNENPNLFWGDETHFVITALKDFVEAQKTSVEKIAVDGKTPFFTPEYFDQMTEQIIGKILELQQPTRPEITVSNND
jgi:hypothetical protein